MPHNSSEFGRGAKPLCHSVAECLDHYFETLQGHKVPQGLYDTVITEVERPLLHATLRYCEGNQSRAAELLGLNRATLRKKLSQHSIDPSTAGSSAPERTSIR